MTPSSQPLDWPWLATRVGLVCCAVLCAAGCQRTPETVPAYGKVLFNGKPLTFGSVTFQPETGQPARGEINAQGEFELSTYRPGDGAVPGVHKIRVACYESQAPNAPKSEGEQSLGRLLIPSRYTLFDQSELTATLSVDSKEPIILELTD